VLEQVVVRAPEAQERFEVGHVAIFAAAVRGPSERAQGPEGLR
jgi:hypothetical protein